MRSIIDDMFLYLLHQKLPVEIVRVIIDMRWPYRALSLLQQVLPKRRPVLSMMYKEYYVSSHCSMCIDAINAVSINTSCLGISPGPLFASLTYGCDFSVALVQLFRSKVGFYPAIDFQCEHNAYFEVVYTLSIK